jgi:hypothetical protein
MYVLKCFSNFIIKLVIAKKHCAFTNSTITLEVELMAWSMYNFLPKQKNNILNMGGMFYPLG